MPPSDISRLGPVPTRAGPVALRPLQRRDGPAWRSIRIRDERSLRPWDVTSGETWTVRHSRGQWRRHRLQLAAAEKRGEAMAFAITVNDLFAGQLTFGGIQRGALRSGWVGYWVDSSVHGNGVASAAVALGIDFAFGPGRLHRVEATIAPRNEASRKVVGRLGFRQEGMLERYLDVNGAWRDHLLYAITTEEITRPLTDRLTDLLP